MFGLIYKYSENISLRLGYLFMLRYLVSIWHHVRIYVYIHIYTEKIKERLETGTTLSRNFAGNTFRHIMDPDEMRSLSFHSISRDKQNSSSTELKIHCKIFLH